MLLTITNTKKPATDLGFLLHKHPARCQTAALPFGAVYVFYPEATEDVCTVAMLLDVDPVGLVRGHHGAPTSMPLEQYVNDRPYVCSSFLSVAIARIFGYALNGKCKQNPELVQTKLPLNCQLAVLACKGGEEFLKRLFEPLGYTVTAQRHTLDANFPEWGDSHYFSVGLAKETTLMELLTHLYVLIPVLDNQKHYFIDREEIEKLLKRGEGWLATHPEKEAIALRYLRYQKSFMREALQRLLEDKPEAEDHEKGEEISREEVVEQELRLNDERLGAVLAALKAAGAEKVLDLGCGDGKLLRLLLKERGFKKITGMDVSIRALEVASRRLRLDEVPAAVKERINLLHGSLMYRDRRLEGFDAATVIEVIEHFDMPRLRAFERVLFEFARPRVIVLTTPNREYNTVWENVGPEKLRHRDHRFEWSREEFERWAQSIAEKYGYHVRYLAIGPIHATLGSPTQMAIFTRELSEGGPQG